VVFLHDVPDELARAALTPAKAQSGTPFGKPWLSTPGLECPRRFSSATTIVSFPPTFNIE
jgi:hypothetical protein